MPFSRHIGGGIKLGDGVQRLPVGIGMGPKKIVISNKESNICIGAFTAAIAIDYLRGELESSIETLNDLFQPAIFGRNGIVISKPDDLNFSSTKAKSEISIQIWQIWIHILQKWTYRKTRIGMFKRPDRLEELE